MGVTQGLQELGVGVSGDKKKGHKEHRKKTRMRTLPNEGMTRSWLSKQERLSEETAKASTEWWEIACFVQGAPWEAGY